MFRTEDLLEEFRDIIPRHNKQEWSEELVIDDEKHKPMFEEQISLEPFISYYYVNAKPEVSSSKRIKRETKKFNRSPNRHLSSYNNDNYKTYVYPDSDDEKEVVKREEGDYPLEIIRSDGLVRITTQTPFVNDKNNIKVKVYNDSSAEISIDNDGDPLQNNKKYYRIVEIPKDADIETAKCTYRNGILEITFKQKKR
jgi:HSP20 family molecular chaperone IbpA